MIRRTNNERLARLERMGEALHRKVDALLRAANIEIHMEIEQMADFSKLVAEVAKIKGAAASTTAFVAGLQKQVADLAAGMNDEEDQSKVEALAADIAAISATLPQAIAADPGGSMGGDNT